MKQLIDGLAVVGDKSELRTLVQEVEYMDKVIYANWDIVNIALDNVWEVLLDADALPPLIKPSNLGN